MEELREQILDLCNNSQLPIDAIFYILKDIYRDARDTYSQYCEQRKVQKQKEEQKEEE